MKKTTFLGSTLGVLLLFSIISYSQTLGQQQSSKANQPANQPASQTAANPAADTATNSSATAADSAARPRETTNATPPNVEAAESAENFEATAYSLHGRTASGAAATQGIIAADPRVLPIGSRVRIDAGSYSGEYVVADTGGAVRGKRIDIWTPNSREAMRFGRRTVKLTVLHLAGKRGKPANRPRPVNAK